MLQNTLNFLTERSQHKWLFYLLFVLSPSFLDTWLGFLGAQLGFLGAWLGFLQFLQSWSRAPLEVTALLPGLTGIRKESQKSLEEGRHRHRTVHEKNELSFPWKPFQDLTIPWIFAISFIPRVSISAYFYSLSLTSPSKSGIHLPFAWALSPKPSPCQGQLSALHIRAPWGRTGMEVECAIPSPWIPSPGYFWSFTSRSGTQNKARVYILLSQHKHFAGRWIVAFPFHIPGETFPEKQSLSPWLSRGWTE